MYFNKTQGDPQHPATGFWSGLFPFIQGVFETSPIAHPWGSLNWRFDVRFALAEGAGAETPAIAWLSKVFNGFDACLDTKCRKGWVEIVFGRNGLRHKSHVIKYIYIYIYT